MVQSVAITKEAPTTKETPQVSAPKPEPPMIEFKEVSKKYGQIIALYRINLKIKRGEFVSIVGPSGAGKSTLVRLLIREELPTKGRVFVSGRDISRLQHKELPYFRRKVGVVFQDFKLLPQKTVWENVAYALEVCDAPKFEIERKVPKIIDLVGLAQRASSYPDELSGGEKQRTSIARALVHSPKLLIADEPTGNIDPQTAKEIIQLLLKINQAGTIVILATHNKDIVDRLKKRVVTLRQGKIIGDQPLGKYVI